MARTLKQEDYAAKRNEILDVAQRLIYTRGYDQMSIQDIIAELRISKGAFYHYFDSKQALLEGIIERTVQQVEVVLLPIVNDTTLSALDKFRTCMQFGAQWKSARMDFMFSLLSAWYHDDNALARQKITASMNAHVRPWLAVIFKQGNEQGIFSAPSSEQAAQVVLTLMVGLGDAIGQTLLAVKPESTPEERAEFLRQMHGVSSAYNHAIERTLGLPSGSLNLFDTAMMKDWVNFPGQEHAETATALAESAVPRH